MSEREEPEVSDASVADDTEKTGGEAETVGSANMTPPQGGEQEDDGSEILKGDIAVSAEEQEASIKDGGVEARNEEEDVVKEIPISEGEYRDREEEGEGIAGGEVAGVEEEGGEEKKEDIAEEMEKKEGEEDITGDEEEEQSVVGGEEGEGVVEEDKEESITEKEGENMTEDKEEGVAEEGEDITEDEVTEKEGEDMTEEEEGVAENEGEDMTEEEEGVAENEGEDMTEEEEGVAEKKGEDMTENEEGVAEKEGEDMTEDEEVSVAEKEEKEDVAGAKEKTRESTDTTQDVEVTMKGDKKEKKRKKKEEEEKIYEYDYEKMKSIPQVVNVSIENMLELHHSYGYESHKRFNLVVLDVGIVAYTAGNMIVIQNMVTQEQTCLRSLSGGGIGTIAVHPSQMYFAVGEKGTNPFIAIYNYPQLSLYRILRDGTEAMYSHMDFSPGDGNLLASVGGDPDFMLTVWDWAKEKIVLRYKAFSQDIFRVTFSPDNPQQLTTSGTGHIRFWKMATTFTGLKLQGQLGKFGRIEISDISAYMELPDGKVLSGTEWGNFLLWDGGFIKVEISKRGKKLCHNGMIEAIYLDEGELISAGIDGFIRIWDFETIDSADITDDNATFEIEPMMEIKVGNNVCLKSMVRSMDPHISTLWYGQDAAGAIWKIDIVVSHTRKPPEKIMSFHGGEIMGLNCSPVTHQAASISQNGSVRVYSLPDKQVLCHSEFASGGSSLIWAPVSVDAQAVTIIAGFTDGVLRVLRLEEKERRPSLYNSSPEKCLLRLEHVCKPHNQAVTCLSIDPQGKILASGSKDSTVFFFNIEENYDPIGFIHTPSAVTTLQWSPSELKLLVCCLDGSMMEVEAPVKGDYNTSKTYYLDPLKFTSRKFTSIKDKLRAQEEEARRAAEEEKQRLEKEARKIRRKELLGDDYVSEDEEEEDKEEVEEEEEIKETPKPKAPSSILGALYSKEDRNQYWISMSGYDAGYLYRCSMDGAGPELEPYEPSHTLPVPAINDEDIPIHSFTFSSSGEYFLTGTENGCVRIHPTPTPHALVDLSSYWSLNIHDNHYGAVTHIATTFDDQFVLTGGADGNVFVYRANLPTTAEKAEAAMIKIPPKSGDSVVNDIDDPEHYSIEDAKLKAEHDRKLKLAEEKKQHVRRQIASLRRTFSKLQGRNSQLPAHLRLEPKEFVMDPGMEEQLKQETEKKVELVRKETSWESEKHKVALNKLKTKYKKIVNCEHFTVYSFKNPYKVHSFRSPLPSKRFMECVEQLRNEEFHHTALSSTESGAQKTREAPTGKRSKRNLDLEEVEETELLEEMSKEEIRRFQKQQRLRERQEHESMKPDEKSDDPEDAAAYKQARENMGDYKLKTANDFVVHDIQRVNTLRKKKELLLHRQMIFDTKEEFNNNLISLRNRKLQLVERIKELISKVENLQSTMSPAHHKPLPPVPVVHPDEIPEKQLEYTKESLLKFKAEQAAREKAEKLEAAGLGEGGFFGGFGGGGDEGEEGKEKVTQEEGEEPGAGQVSELKQEGGTSRDGDSEISETGSSIQDVPHILTPIQKLKHQEHQIRCIFQRDHFLKEIETLQKDFDMMLLLLYHEKVHLDITIMTAEVKHITYFEEMSLLKEFEKSETVFTSRYKTKKHERHAMATKIDECQWDLSEKEKELGRLQEQEKLLITSFNELVGDNKFKDFLLKVFRKKIKRIKRRPEMDKEQEDGEEEEEEEEDEEEDTESDLSSSDEDSETEGELDDSICPPGCDQTLFNQICELRENRLDLEEMIAEGKKTLETQRKELDSLKKKAKSMESQEKTALSDLQAFQLKKQQRLNELDQLAVLYLHQILHFMPEGDPPNTIAPCLVFSASTLYQLDQRIGELALEKQHEKKKYKELKYLYKKLGREKKEMLSDLAVLNEQVNQAMLLKFGQIVDLEKLEVLNCNPAIDEKRVQLREMEVQANRQMTAVQAKIDQKRRELLRVVQENTLRLNRMHDLITTKKEVEERLDARQKSMSKEVSGGGDSHLSKEEHERLLEIIHLQSVDIESVKEEIKILQHKGGHILPPNQPPTISFSQES